MNGNWAFNWVLIMHHNWPALGRRFALVTLVAAAGVIALPAEIGSKVMIYLAASTLVMALLMGLLFDTRRAAGLHLGLSLLILLLTFGMAGWLLNEVNTRDALLGGVVVLTMMTSNLVHLLGAVLREMARGQFQHDAVAEGLKHNAGPILLANLTTVLGFVISAWINPDLSPMAWIVSLGALASLWVTLTWLPWILLRWFLEFRVGNPQDRHGYGRLVRWLSRHRWLPRLIAVGGLLLLVGLSSWAVMTMGTQFMAIAVMLGVTFLLLMVVWSHWGMAALAVALNWGAVVCAAWLWVGLTNQSLSPFALLVPLGLVIDDSIHFFTRYVRAMHMGLLDTPLLRVRFALGSVGRTIWMTSLLLIAGLSVLLLVGDALIVQAVYLTGIAMLLATWLLIVWLPALLLSYRVETNK
ncbi:MAG TPA: hypothetical protein EYH46_04795 [Sulfurivirga caldicuralii]|nr:hypothetical protein [Sulfurivirga caldicuralii]